MSCIKLSGVYTIDRPDRTQIGTVKLTLPLGDGTVIEMPAPFLTVGVGLGITPYRAPDGDRGIRFDFSRWAPLCFGPNLVAELKIAFPGQELATRACRAFAADPAIDWRDPHDEIAAWARDWTAANGQTAN